MELRKKLLAVASLAFATALSAGVAVAASAEEEKLKGFNISAVSVRTENFKKQDVEIENTSGIRFKTDAPEKAEGASYYTTVSVAGVKESKKVKAESWRTDGSGWNTVIVRVPSTAYATPITVTSYAEIGGKTYASNTVTSSLAEASAKALANGEVSPFLTQVVDTVVEDVYFATETLSLYTGNYVNYAADLFFAESVTADASKYAIVYTTDNAEVATVDANGKIVAVGAGEATITATIGSKTDSVVVTVADTTAYDFENGYGVDFITPTFSTEKTMSVVSFNGSKALKMTSTAGKKNLAFDIDGAYLDKVFADSNVNGVSFDLTFVYSGETENPVKVDYEGRVFDWNKTLYFESNNTQKINISRVSYNAWKADADAPATFRMVIDNRGLALEWYIDNLQVTTAAQDTTPAVSTLFNTAGWGGTGYWNSAEDNATYFAYDGQDTIRFALGAGKEKSAPIYKKGTAEGQLQAAFADTWVSAYSFYVFNPNGFDAYIKFAKEADYDNYNFAEQKVDATKLPKYQWTKVTLTRAEFEQKVNLSSNFILLLMVFTETAQSGITYFSMDGFHKETATQDYGEQLVSLGAAYSATVAINTNTDYINEGKTSISLTTSRDSNFGFAIRGILWKHLTKGDWESISFDIYVSKPYTYQIGWVDKVTEADYPNHWGTFTVGWNTITITKEMYTAIADAYAGYKDTTAAMDFKFLNGGLATGDVAYIDNFRVSYS